MAEASHTTFTTPFGFTECSTSFEKGLGGKGFEFPTSSAKGVGGNCFESPGLGGDVFHPTSFAKGLGGKLGFDPTLFPMTPTTTPTTKPSSASTSVPTMMISKNPLVNELYNDIFPQNDSRQPSFYSQFNNSDISNRLVSMMDKRTNIEQIDTLKLTHSTCCDKKYYDVGPMRKRRTLDKSTHRLITSHVIKAGKHKSSRNDTKGKLRKLQKLIKEQIKVFNQQEKDEQECKNGVLHYLEEFCAPL